MNASYAECKSLPQERSILDIINCEEWASDHFITVYTQGRPPVRMTLGELQGTVRRVASWLMDRGLKSGDRIGILAHNSLEWILLDLACIRQGIVTAGFEPEAFASRVDLTDTYDLQLLVCDRLCAAAVDAGERFVPLQSIPTIGTVEDLAIPLPPPYRFHLDECSTIKQRALGRPLEALTSPYAAYRRSFIMAQRTSYLCSCRSHCFNSDTGYIRLSLLATTLS